MDLKTASRFCLGTINLSRARFLFRLFCFKNSLSSFTVAAVVLEGTVGILCRLCAWSSSGAQQWGALSVISRSWQRCPWVLWLWKPGVSLFVPPTQSQPSFVESDVVRSEACLGLKSHAFITSNDGMQKVANVVTVSSCSSTLPNSNSQCFKMPLKAT